MDPHYRHQAYTLCIICAYKDKLAAPRMFSQVVGWEVDFDDFDEPYC